MHKAKVYISFKRPEQGVRLKRYSVHSLVSAEMFTRRSFPSRPVHVETISILRGYSRAAGSI